jgi:hypothetical protein
MTKYTLIRLSFGSLFVLAWAMIGAGITRLGTAFLLSYVAASWRVWRSMNEQTPLDRKLAWERAQEKDAQLEVARERIRARHNGHRPGFKGVGGPSICQDCGIPWEDFKTVPCRASEHEGGES